MYVVKNEESIIYPLYGLTWSWWGSDGKLTAERHLSASRSHWKICCRRQQFHAVSFRSWVSLMS